MMGLAVGRITMAAVGFAANFRVRVVSWSVFEIIRWLQSINFEMKQI